MIALPIVATSFAACSLGEGNGKVYGDLNVHDLYSVLGFADVCGGFALVIDSGLVAVLRPLAVGDVTIAPFIQAGQSRGVLLVGLARCGAD